MTILRGTTDPRTPEQVAGDERTLRRVTATILPSANLMQYPDEESWLVARRAGIGSTDAQKLYRAIPDGGAESLVIQKAGTVPQFEDFVEPRKAATGKKLERFLVEWVGEEIGQPVVHVRHAVAVNYFEPWLTCSPDGFVLDEEGAPCAMIEAKATTALIEWDDADRRWRAIKWGSGHRPLRWAVQTQHQLAVTGLPRIYHPVFIGSELRMEFDTIERNERFIANHRARCERVWREIVEEKRLHLAAGGTTNG